MTPEERLADYEHRISWGTTCQSCAAVLDAAYADTARAERAEAKVAAVEALHTRQTLQLFSGRHYDACAGCGITWPCPTRAALETP